MRNRYGKKSLSKKSGPNPVSDDIFAPENGWTAEDFQLNRDIDLRYYLTLAEITWARMDTRERKRLHRQNSLVYSIIKGIGESR